MTVSNNGYANPNALVSTAWVAEHLDDPTVQIVESNEDALLYDIGHIPGAIKIDWTAELQDQTIRDFIDETGFNQLMSAKGITPDTTVVLYGDKSNWWATYTYWFFRYMGHDRVKVMNGGRAKWEEEGREMNRVQPAITPTTYSGARRRPEFRAFRDEVLQHAGYDGLAKVRDGKPMVDVRSPAEFSGEVTHMADYPQEGVLRGGHIPGAANIPWAQAANEDGTFKSAEELRDLYGEKGIVPEQDVITYCRIGERSSHTWFVLHELLGYPNVRNYDGSWTEWGNILRAPVEK